MAVKYVPYFKEPIEGQAILDNFTRTRRIYKTVMTLVSFP